MISTLFFYLLHVAVYANVDQLSYRLMIEYVIPTYQSYLALARKESDSGRSVLQYWYLIRSFCQYRVSLIVVDWILVPVEPIYEKM